MMITTEVGDDTETQVLLASVLDVSSVNSRRRVPFKPDQVRVDRGDWLNASGLCICDTCGCDYDEHADVYGYNWLTRLCNGELVKL